MKKEIIIAGIMGVMSSPTFAQNFYQCTPCPAGTYAESGQCKSCSAGTFSKGATSSCEACPTGTYSSSSASFCAPCQSKPANSHFTSNATSDSCSWDCDSGFSKSGNLCCASNYTESDGKCCPSGKIEVKYIKNTYNVSCGSGPCTITPSDIGCGKKSVGLNYETIKLDLGKCITDHFGKKTCNICGIARNYCPNGTIESYE